MATRRPPIPRKVSLPHSLWVFVDQKVADGQAKSTEDYLQELVRRARRREDNERRELEVLLQEGLDSGPSIPMDAAFWAERRRKLAQRQRRRKTRR